MIKRIVWMSWKDGQNPLAGGAEKVNEEIARQLVKDGVEVIFLVTGFEDAPQKILHPSGFTVIRCGNRYSVYWAVYRYYKKNLNDWPDLVIDEMNTIPFFSNFYTNGKSILLAYQLCRQIWFYQLRFPASLIGYICEFLYLRIINKMPALTESISAKNDLLKFGFRDQKVKVFKVPLEMTPLSSISDITKYSTTTLLSLGNIRPMKRTLDQIKAFEKVKEKLPDCKLIVAGGSDSEYGSSVLEYIDKSPYKRDIKYMGFIDEKNKLELLRLSHIIMVTSVKEGWGLIVTEANSQGTPAVVYDVDGLRDSVQAGVTGIICKKNNPNSLAEAIIKCLDQNRYPGIRIKAWEYSKQFTPLNSYRDFLKGLNELRG